MSISVRLNELGIVLPEVAKPAGAYVPAVISGNLVLPDLGIEPQIRETLIDEVNLVICNAATTNLMEPFDVAFQTNYFGALRLQDLARECKHLDAYVYVSTAYVNTNQPPNSVIPEKLMDVSVDPEEYVS